tara:strand:+ start:180 stop:437 length:258 start_codon:yes stop_codon:yes gene_type:complete
MKEKWSIQVDYQKWTYNFTIENYREELEAYGGCWLEDILNDELLDCMLEIKRDLKLKELPHVDNFTFRMQDENKKDLNTLINENI